MTSPQQRLLDRLQRLERSAVTAHQVQVVGLDPLSVAGMDGDAEVQAYGSFTPALGETVWLHTTGSGGAVITDAVSPRRPPSPNGTVATAPASGATTVAVTVDGTVESLPWLAGWTPTAGALVRIDWQPTADGGWSGCVLGPMGQAPIPKPPPAREIVESSSRSSVASSGVTILRAIEAGTARSGGWRGDTTKIVQSTWTSSPPSTGYWFYGAPPAEVRGATVTKAEIYLRALSGGTNAARPVSLYLHGASRKPRTPPALASASPFSTPSIAVGARGWFPILPAAAQQIIDRINGGIAAASTSRADYRVLSGLSGDGRDPMTGALRITWSRND